jgi:hypothetical protein
VGVSGQPYPLTPVQVLKYRGYGGPCTSLFTFETLRVRLGGKFLLETRARVDVRLLSLLGLGWYIWLDALDSWLEVYTINCNLDWYTDTVDIRYTEIHCHTPAQL